MDPMVRDHAGDARDDRANQLDIDAAASDIASELRDNAADARDECARVRETGDDGPDPFAIQERFWALRDRRAAAGDRVRSANLRAHAHSDRAEAARDRAASSLDDMTGAYRRDSGVAELVRDLEMSRRTNVPMVVGFLDVDGLKSINDTRGHTAGDHILHLVVQELRTNLRKYDLIVRYGGDEFVFSMVGATDSDARARVELANHTLEMRSRTSVSYGVVTVKPEESLIEAIDRADHSLYEQRRHDQRS